METSELLHEDVLLLVLDDKKGTCRNARGELVLAAALLLDLVRAGAVVVDSHGVRVVDSSELEPGILMDVASLIDEESRRHDARWWIERLPRDIRPFLVRVAARLVAQGVLYEQEHKYLGLFGAETRFPEQDHAREASVRDRMREVLLGSVDASADDAVLVTLVHAAGLVDALVGKDERAEARRRAAELGRDGIVGDAMERATKAAQDAVVSAAVASATAAGAAATVAGI